jgi:uncharacterized protein (TIGR03067 family)
MCRSSSLALSCIVVLSIDVCVNLCRGQTGPDNNQAEQSIIGPWRADSVVLLRENGIKRILPQNTQQTFSIVISEKNLTMRVGDQKFAEMTFILDTKQTPSTIDLKFQDQDMQGIYQLKGNNLKISLNDAKKGRPNGFGRYNNDMDFALRRFNCEPIMMINADGTDLHALTSMTDYTSCGSPDWSPDGSKIAFDTCRSLFGESWTKSHILTVNTDGTDPKDLGDGAQPTWSPDGKRIAYSRYSPNNGIWVMNADGSDNRLIDLEGWIGDWSPKNDELAYIISGGRGTNIRVQDLKTQERRHLLDKKYIGVFDGLSWSPNGQWICFKGKLPDGSSELAVVHAEGQAKGFRVLLPNEATHGLKDVNRFFSWNPDGKQILVSMLMEGDTNLQLYLIDPEGNMPPQKLAGQDPSCANYGSSWSPDGKKIVLSFWPGTPVAKKD